MLLVKLKQRRAKPIPRAEILSAALWLRRADTNPEEIWATKNPIEIMRKSDPAWLWLSPTAPSSVGMRGARVTRAMKLRKKRLVMNKMGANRSLKVCGMGQELSLPSTVIT
jgi:hypothetical protein